MRKQYNIGELAEIFSISTNKIRYYEEKGLLSPKRNLENEYRTYDENDILNLQSILLYRGMGFSIKDIDKLLKSYSKDNYIKYFNNQWEAINNEIQRLSVIRKYMEEILDRAYQNEININDDILEIIKESNYINDIKNNWKDKWDFNGWASKYDELVKKDNCSLNIYGKYDELLSEVFKAAKEKNPKNVLEIGVGTGNLASKFIDENIDIVGVDQSREMLAVAKEKLPSLKVRLGEFLKIPYEDKSFDCIVSTYAFHHLNQEEKEVAIDEIIRVLKDNGKIIIGDLMFKNHDHEEAVLSNLSKEEIDIIKDEYYSYINELEDIFNAKGKKFRYKQVDEFLFIIEAM